MARPLGVARGVGVRLAAFETAAAALMMTRPPVAFGEIMFGPHECLAGRGRLNKRKSQAEGVA